MMRRRRRSGCDLVNLHIEVKGDCDFMTLYMPESMNTTVVTEISSPAIGIMHLLHRVINQM